MRQRGQSCCSPGSACSSSGNSSNHSAFLLLQGGHKNLHTSKIRHRFSLLKLLSRSLSCKAQTGPGSARNKANSPVPSSNRLQLKQSIFEATGREDIRSDLAHYGCGSVNWCNLVAMGERVHGSLLQQLQAEPDCQLDWAGEPAWQDDFTGIAGKHAKRMHHRMEWTYFGGQAVAHIPDEVWWRSSSDNEIMGT